MPRSARLAAAAALLLAAAPGRAAGSGSGSSTGGSSQGQSSAPQQTPSRHDSGGGGSLPNINAQSAAQGSQGVGNILSPARAKSDSSSGAVPDAGGIYRSTRPDQQPGPGSLPPMLEASPAPQMLPVETATAPAAEAAAGIDEARQSLPSLVSAYVAARSRAGLFSLRDAKGACAPVRLDAADPNSVAQEPKPGEYSIAVRFFDANGRPVEAQAFADLSGPRWRIERIVKGAPAAARGARACFVDAVKSALRARSRRGEFVLRDDELGRDWRLKLETIHGEGVKPFGGEGYYACVDFRDLAAGQAVDLDFYAYRVKGRCRVEQVVIHRVGGKARTTKPKALGAQ